MLGALYRYLRETDPKRFQPMNANFGLMEPLEHAPRDKFEKKRALAERALRDMQAFCSQTKVCAHEGTALKGSESPGPPFRVWTP
jgi:methylenetetrahydrofolate--tRNA-(uracil-5-)-methyltransferase